MIITVSTAIGVTVFCLIALICVQKRQMDKRNAMAWGDADVWCPSDTVASVSAFFQRVTFFLGARLRDLLTLYRLIPDWYPYWLAAKELYDNAFPMGPGYFFWSGVMAGNRLTWLDAVVCVIVTQVIMRTLDAYVIEFPDAPNPEVPHWQVVLLYGLVVAFIIMVFTGTAVEAVLAMRKHKTNEKTNEKVKVPRRRSARIHSRHQEEDESDFTTDDENDE